MTIPQVNRDHPSAPDLPFWRGGPTVPRYINQCAAAAWRSHWVGARGCSTVSTRDPDQTPRKRLEQYRAPGHPAAPPVRAIRQGSTHNGALV